LLCAAYAVIHIGVLGLLLFQRSWLVIDCVLLILLWSLLGLVVFPGRARTGLARFGPWLILTGLFVATIGAQIYIHRDRRAFPTEDFYRFLEERPWTTVALAAASLLLWVRHYLAFRQQTLESWGFFPRRK